MRERIGRTTTKVTHWLITVVALTAVAIWLTTKAVSGVIGPIGVGFPTLLVVAGSTAAAIWIGSNIIPDRQWAPRARHALWGVAIVAAVFLYLYYSR
jgi:hypothetical protein